MIKLRKDSVTWAINSVEKDYDTYLFPMPFEYEAIRENIDDVVDYISNLNVLEEGIRDYRSVLSPKSVIGFRIATQLDPIDTIISLALIYETSKELESARVPISNNIVHSYRLAPQNDGTLYDPEYNWRSFQDQAGKIIRNDSFSHVILTDISDFYPSIYLHDIETVLSDALVSSGRKSHGQVLINYIKAMHFSQTHKGLPVGPQFSRPIAELVMNDIDQILIQKNIKFLRYVDDYIIFTTSKAESYKTLSIFAQSLYERRGLKLNEKKSKILEKDVYIKKYHEQLDTFEDSSIIDNFNALLKELDIDQDPYIDLDPDEISEQALDKLRSVNLSQLVEDELLKDEPDSYIISFVLANLARIDDIEFVDTILQEENLVKLFPKLRTIINYLERVRNFSETKKHEIGEIILRYVDNSYISVLEFNRMWFLHLFTKSTEWNNTDELLKLYEKYQDNISRRETILAMGRAKNIEFFRNIKYEDLDTNNWLRRSKIAAISCLPEQERKPWYKSFALRSRDFLDKIVAEWAQKNHF